MFKPSLMMHGKYGNYLQYDLVFLSTYLMFIDILHEVRECYLALVNISPYRGYTFRIHRFYQSARGSEFLCK